MTLFAQDEDILNLKRRTEQAIENNESLFDLRDEISLFLAQLPDNSEYKKVLNDYRLKILIEIERRKTTTDFIFGDLIESSFFTGDFSTVFLDYQLALKYVLILKRLELLRLFYERNFEEYERQAEGIRSYLILADRVSPEFSELYSSDFQSINRLYAYFIGERRIPNRKGLLKQLTERYGEVWAYLESSGTSSVLLDSREVLAMKAAYSSLDLWEPWTRETLKRGEKEIKLTFQAGGGSLLNFGIYWEPQPWFALSAGISGAYDFFNRSGEESWLSDGSPSLSFSLPLEADFFILNGKFELFLGITADLIRFQDKASIHWSNGFVRDSEGFQVGSRIAFWTSFGINLGMGIDLGKVDLYLSNYFYMTDFNLKDFNIYSLRYSPAIGVRL